MARKHLRRLLLLFFAILVLPSLALPQQDDVDLVEARQFDQDRLDQRTPLAAAQGFMRASEAGDHQFASRYLDLRYLPEGQAGADGARLAEQLYVVIVRKLRVEFESLSSDTEGLADDGLPDYLDRFGEIATARGARTLYLQRIPAGNERSVWRISGATVAQIPQLYEQYGYSPSVEAIRRLTPEGSFLGIEFFKWVFALAAATASALAWLAFAWPITRAITQAGVGAQARIKHYLTRPVPWVIFVLVGYWVLWDLGLGVTASRVAHAGTLVTIVVVWLLFASINLFSDLYSTYLQSRGRDAGLMLLRPVTSTIKVVIAILAVTIWLDNVGVDVTALIAGLGVGGLAVALVLQKPLEDILGAMTLFTQQPVRIGQFCTSGSITGTIEDISLRSTRIRKLDNNVVIIPNAQFATASILNASEKSRTLHRQIVRLSLSTTSAQISDLLDKLSEVLTAEADVIDDQWRVRFIELGEYSKNIEIVAHVATADWKEFLEIAERINLATVGVLDAQGLELAVRPR